MEINQILPQESKFLQITQTIAKKPKALYFTGKLPENRLPTVAIVGSRKPTPYGQEVTEMLAFELAKRGAIIVSGLAYGVDAIAHKAALQAKGTTVAVLGGGLPSIYPAAHRQLAYTIVAEGGALITEYPTGVSPRPYQFLERNRLISALSDIVIITEAASRSGTLNTVMHALDQGKDVFAVPGNITSPLSGGCNALIRQGAQPLTRLEDITEQLFPKQAVQKRLPVGQTALEQRIIDALQAGVRDGDALHALCGAPIAEFSQALTMLEISGIIRSLGAHQWTLANR